MFLSFSSLLIACIVYHYCCDDENFLFTYSLTEEISESCLRSSSISRPYWKTSESMEKSAAPYGTWKSPIQSSLIVENTVTPTEIQVDVQGRVYWLELRPSEAGRYALRSNQTENDLLPKTFNCRTRVHEYGGGSYIVRNDQVYFTNFADQRIYHFDINSNSEPTAFSKEPSERASLRYADFNLDSVHGQLICVHEDHHNESDVKNSIVAISTKDPSSMVTLDSGYDFYSSPRISPDGKHLVWLSWNHPNMPWDETELWIGEVAEGSTFSLANKRKLFGQNNESIVQPEWSPDGKYVYFSSDRSGWWNIYRITPDGQTSEQICQMEAEFGGPAWQFASSYYGFDSKGNLVASYWKDGLAKLVHLDVTSKQMTPISLADEYTDIFPLRVHHQKVYFIGSSATKPKEMIELDLDANTKETLCRSTHNVIDPRYLSVPEMVTFKSGDAVAHGIYYPPKNDDYQVPKDTKELPPLLVRSHGGPTSSTTSAFNPRIQYWTSRGFALLDVNYRGSTGYGRKYRDSLKNNWGIYDVEDCVSGAEYLVEQNKADRNRLTIDGGSAGGYTTLCALTMKNYFSAGASHYGVSDLETLARDTHKFESRYLDCLVGEYPAKKNIYQERSPISHIANLSRPIIFFQGSEDKIVLPNQAESMVNALRQKNLPVAYVLFDGEQHGFRKAENIRKSLDGQFYFFSKIFGFQMADQVDPILIENLAEN